MLDEQLTDICSAELLSVGSLQNPTLPLEPFLTTAGESSRVEHMTNPKLTDFVVHQPYFSFTIS